MTVDEKIVLDKIQRYLRLDDGKPFLERVAWRRNRVIDSLASNSEVIQIGRSQGRLEILNWILNDLKED